MAGKKENNRKSGALARHKARLREEAAERQEKRDRRSNAEQIALLKTRRGSSKREVARLLPR